MLTLSVIFPVYNQRREYLEASIKSILQQSFRNFEILLIDDGSTNEDCLKTLQFFAERDSRIRIIKNKSNVGLIRTLNRGLSLAKGKYIARMDSDDISLPKRFEKQISFLKKHQDIDLVGSFAFVIDENDRKIGGISLPISSESIKKNIFTGNPLIHPTWMFRSSLISSLGNYSENAQSTEDYDFLFRVIRSHRVANIPEPLLLYRFNAKGISFAKNKRQEWESINLRMRAIREYGYPKWRVISLIRPFFFFIFLPWPMKKILLRFLFWKNKSL